MLDSIKRMIDNAHPELTAGSHLPRHAVIINARQTPKGGELHDEFKPVYAVDVQVLDAYGQPDNNYPVLKDVPLPVPTAGNDSGFFSYPENGATVEIGFAYGSPNKPFIRSVLPNGKTLTPVERGEMRLQFDASTYLRFDKDGNFDCITAANYLQRSAKHIIDAVENSEAYTKSLLSIEANSSEQVGGIKSIHADGAINLLSGGRLDLGAAADLNLTSLTAQNLKAPLTWIGSQDENVLTLLSELMQLVINLSNTLAAHTHTSSGTGVPVQSTNIATIGTDTGGIKTRLDSIRL